MSKNRWRQFNDLLTSITPARLRYFLYILAVGLLMVFLVLNQIFLNNLENQARTVAHKEARLYAVAIAEQLTRNELNVIFNEIVRKSQVPMIITDNQQIPINWKNISLPRWFSSDEPLPQVPYPDLAPEAKNHLKMAILEYDRHNEPLKLEAEGHSFGYLHYMDLPLVNLLAWMPILEVAVLLLLLFLGYFGFQIIRSNEQSLLWVGLAKETAHQLGTPISSLLGWIDFLKMRLSPLPNAEKNLELLGEMESDISRLNKVATRFSQIGSIPDLREDDMNKVIQTTSDYYKTRLPQLGKKIDIELQLNDLPTIWVNRELIGWVFENLIKNAADSIEVKNGLIIISTEYSDSEKAAYISISDNGKGIPKEHLKQIFHTGFTTKKRGWGLGLALAKRIVEEYHEGKIYVEKSHKEVGTIFKIILPVHPGRVQSKR